jgi:hypothetical protein
VISLARGTRVYAYAAPADLRKYAGSVVMRSVAAVIAEAEATARDSLRITPAGSR